jgi:cell division protein FtsB
VRRPLEADPRIDALEQRVAKLEKEVASLQAGAEAARRAVADAQGVA